MTFEKGNQTEEQKNVQMNNNSSTHSSVCSCFLFQEGIVIIVIFMLRIEASIPSLVCRKEGKSSHKKMFR